MDTPGGEGETVVIFEVRTRRSLSASSTLDQRGLSGTHKCISTLLCNTRSFPSLREGGGKTGVLRGESSAAIGAAGVGSDGPAQLSSHLIRMLHVKHSDPPPASLRGAVGR